MKIKELIEEAYKNAKIHGFWDDIEALNMSNIDALSSDFKQLLNNAICTRLMLITGETAEAMEGLRKGDANNFKEELADIIIRTCDLAGGLDIDLEAEIIKKMDKNKDRPYKHGKAF
jgi:NTP pyrophosphatase (non-canonical NTP hydrolase)